TDNSSTDVTVSTTRARLTGLGSTAPTAYSGILAAESSVEDIHGNITVSRTYIDRANKTVWSVTDVPDSTTDVVSETVNGMLVQETSPSGHTNHLLYDALERPVGVTDPRISSYDAQAGTWSNVYETGYNGYGQVNWTKDPEGNQTTYGYDSTTGLQTSVTDALSKVKNVHHDLRGLVLGTWGAAAQPKYYEYDEFGRMTKLHTLRDDSVTISSYKSFATNSGSFDTTTWTYQSSTGLMTAKTHADGKGTTYAYDSAGRLATRTWARTVGGNALATTYGYDDASGQLVSIDYSDATTRLAYTYDRLGRTRTVTDATGSRSFAYNSNLQLSTETLGSPFYASKILTRLYQGAADVPGRYEGLQAGTSQDPDADLDATHEYDAYGRIHATAWTVASVSRKAGYSYDANSDLVEGYAVPEGGGVTISTATVFEDHRDLIESVQNGWGTTTTSKYEYTNDDIARRTDVVMTGDEFDTDVFNHYAYSDRSELTAANRYNGTDITDTSSPVTAYDYDFDYDPIGNRKTRAVAGTTTTYTTDQLNQYTAVTSLTNPTYDPDGNMTLLPSPSGGGAGGGGWLCQWNAENRLVSATTTDAKLEFVYDYMGRRVRKKVHSGTTENWTEDSDTIYVYDGWNVVLELNANSSNATIKTYVWGLDLSQTLQGAGGVGGLLVVVENDATNSPRYYPLYDANGNVSEYLDSTGGVAAHYEYSPFGDLTATTGAKAADFAHRFSTKYLDTETNLYYYGSRYYTPELGRWLSRDPIGERGGYNLYGFVGNSPLVYTDLNGLFPGVAYLLDMYVELAVRTGNESVAAAAATTSTYARLLLPDPVHITHGAWARFVGYKELQFTNRTAAGLVVGTSVPGGGIVFRGFELNDGVCLEPNGFADQLDKEGKDSRKLLIGGEGLLIGTYVMGTIGLDVNLGGPHIFRTPCSNSTRRPRARHHTNRQGANGIDADGAVDPARGNPRGVDVEVEPFGPTKPGLHGPKAETGAAAEGAYVEFDLPDSAISTNVGPRNTARIPTNEPLPIRNLNPTIVKPPWWKFW
ncbi:MAG: RHS repeat-associated core domain-containing protein, partial [Lentisphaeria bacterium]|nr:RHS repeat-associated core domain-containing protein [Lentisphaeria bacterium]